MTPHERSEKCKEVFSLLSQYLDVELPPGACREIEAHISDCAPCVEFTETLRKSIELCHHYEPSEVPGPLGEEVRERLLNAYQRMLRSRNLAL